MKHTLAGLALALVFFTVAPKANAQEELSNAQSTITVAVPTGGFSCGRSSYPLYCYGVPANIGGTFWLDAYYGAQNGFILFNNMADLGQATITSSSVIKNAGGFVTQLTVGFNGYTNDGDGDTYAGTGVFTFSYYKCSSKYCGYIALMQSGTLTITYN